MFSQTSKGRPWVARSAAWARLLRIPNLPTVPGDPLAGFMLAGMTSATNPGPLDGALAGTAALLIYAFGLVLNDVADREVDLRERPDRPIPEGRIDWRQACRVACVLALAGCMLGLAAGVRVFGAALLLTLLAALYNLVLKRHRLAGPLVMGLCRGTSLCMGALAGGWRPHALDDPVVAGAGGLVVYIAAVTWIAREEASGKPIPFLRMKAWGPLLALGVLWTLLSVLRTPSALAMGFAVLALAWCGATAVALGRDPGMQRIAGAVGGWIRGLLLIQGALIAWDGDAGWWALVAVGLAWGLSSRLSRRFYAS